MAPDIFTTKAAPTQVPDTKPFRGRDLTGQKFGRWTVNHFDGRIARGMAVWSCTCECGEIRKIPASRLLTGHSKSCGCLSQERKTIHGMQATKIYTVWENVIQRCNNPRHPSYKNYGGRGIRVCERWLSAKNFIEDMLPTYQPGLTLDRIDNEGDYEPANCAWRSRREQSNNTRTNRWIEFNGERLTMSQWSKKLGINHQTIHDRLKKRLPLEMVLSPANLSNPNRRVAQPIPEQPISRLDNSPRP